MRHYLFDLDRSLAHYVHQQYKEKGPTFIGPPIPRSVERVKQFLKEGKTVKIFTARGSFERGKKREQIYEAIEKWCLENLGQILEITHTKTYESELLWDDRAVQLLANTGVRADGKDDPILIPLLLVAIATIVHAIWLLVVGHILRCDHVYISGIVYLLNLSAYAVGATFWHLASVINRKVTKFHGDLED